MSVLERVTSTNAPVSTVLIRFAVGIVFFGEGIQKFLYPNEVGAGRFAKIPIPNPETTAFLVGSLEVVCGLMVVFGLLTRLAALPLIGIMLTAIFTTKIPILLGAEFLGFSLRNVSYYGIWGFLHESRTDLAMLFGSIFLLIVGAGRWSLDALLSKSK
ncbi:MAG: DoxX family protein [Pyrinomonadaceae bacterium]